MRQLLTRITVIGAAIVVIALGVTWWSRPDLLASLRQMPLSLSQLRPGEPESQQPAESEEPPLELIEDGWCEAHRQPLERCRANPDVPGSTSRCIAGSLPMIRLSSPEVAVRIGLETARVAERSHADVIRGNAEIMYHEHAFAEVRPRVAGLVDQIAVEHGTVVRKGDLVAVIDSAEIGAIKANYLSTLPVVELAEATLERTRSLTQANALPMKDELEARTSLYRARADLLNASQRLRNLGFTDSDLAKIAQEQDTSSLVRIVAPIDGTVIERHAVPGEAVEPNHQLVAITDLSAMWALIDVYENDIERVLPGQDVTFQIAGVPGRTFHGVVEWVDAAVDPATRTIRVRAELENTDGRLKANEFGFAEIRVGEPHPARFVPADAIQLIDGNHVVFLPEPEGTYRPQRIVLESGEQLSGEEEVVWGLNAGDEVVTTGSFLLKSEMHRDQLAGE